MLDRELAFGDCDGHGTHIAATLAGKDVGVAPSSVVIHPVRVLGCGGGGRASDVVAGLEWIAAHVMSARAAARASSSGAWPAVVTLALGVRAGDWSRSLERAAAALTARVGVLVVVASGNFRSDACGVSPARVPETLTVAASDSRDGMYRWSCTGPCVDLFSPGVDIRSACGGVGRCDTPSVSPAVCCKNSEIFFLFSFFLSSCLATNVLFPRPRPPQLT